MRAYENASEEILAAQDEDEIYRSLGLAYSVPPLPENHREVATAANDTLPDLVSPEDLRGGLHVHTRYSKE